jgi:hybrid cluster-associated redox disulfide protein
MIDLNTTVEDALTSHPELAHLFVRHGMICVGCAIARFHTVTDAAVMYHLEPAALLNELLEHLKQYKDSSNWQARDADGVKAQDA